MKGLRALTLLPMALLLACIVTGVGNYNKAKEEMRQDLTHALRHYVMSQWHDTQLTDTLWTLTPDRIVTLNDAEALFHDQLTIGVLKDTSHISVCMVRRDKAETFKEKATLCSDTLLWGTTAPSGQVLLAFKAYANPTLCSVLSHSDQRVPLAGALCCLLLLSATAWRGRERMSGETPAPAALAAMPPLSLTPMQERLMQLFDAAPDHTLTKEAICAELWPKKDHPENTLYTFISRLKTVLKKQSDYDIVNKRGREYQLTKRTEAD